MKAQELCFSVENRLKICLSLSLHCNHGVSQTEKVKVGEQRVSVAATFNLFNLRAVLP